MKNYQKKFKSWIVIIGLLAAILFQIPANVFAFDFTTANLVPVSNTLQAEFVVSGLTPPTLNGDATNNDTFNDIAVGANTTDFGWQDNVTNILVNGTILSSDHWYVDGGLFIRAGALPEGTHTITVVATGYEDATFTQTIVNNEYELLFTVQDSTSSQVIEGITITLDGTNSVTTDVYGDAAFYVKPGTYSYSVTDDVYELLSSEVTVENANKTEIISLNLQQ